MSRGPGAVQRRITAHLALHEWVSLQDLACRGLALSEPSAAAVESTRRAVHKLAAAGQVETRTAGGRLYARLITPGT